MLSPVTRLCEELFYYMAKPHSSAGKNDAAPSLLPSSLTSGFCSILASYLYLAKRLSLINRITPEDKPQESTAVERSFEGFRHAMLKSFQQASNLLETSRIGIIILCSTRREIDCLRIRSIDVHLLPIAFLQNIQAFSAPQGEDIVQVYRRYLNVLRGQASRRPQRRVFLDIQEYQEELDALNGLTDTQRNGAEKLISLLFTGSFRVTTEARLEKYEAEYELWKKVDRVLEGRLVDLEKLTQQSRRLKEDVKQTIEILEEDHGKAIRVFTVVTLFFLPLSFVSSFMGMNTTDIRDTGHDQRLFWAVAVPVTASVVALALTYGYQGEGLVDWAKSCGQHWEEQWKDWWNRGDGRNRARRQGQGSTVALQRLGSLRDQ